ncbi:uncharacterized protein DUF4163 [Chryseobacterium sp. CBTAP 102]|uniref:PdaC/SigV domain-containing protein n=1 Tax=Chryseobacterium sp. CBTAP 102 TaxID=2135644 RepID=UPI000D76E1BF|nr:DUF4163 domain-containing protein [Chryseobacterium sp. CBTAP 102]PXW11048.1 uncharacterized protein DUF4163 [Chryseobacterium sp. CBTAP 102]
MTRLIGIAIDEYEDKSIKNLNNCKKDIQSIIASLTSKFVFDEVDLFSEKEQTTRSSLYNSLYDILINSLEEDRILIIFAGHGEYNTKTESSYWLLNDSLRHETTSWFNVNELLNLLKYSPAKHIAIISDSCFSGAIFENERGGGYEALTSKRSRFALTSGSIEKVKDGKPNESSPFALALNNFINKFNSDKLSINELGEKTLIEFSKYHHQTPCFGPLYNSGHEGGSFILESITSMDKFQDLNLSLDIHKDIKIDYDFKIPLIKKNDAFNCDFINSFITQKGYLIVNEARIYFKEMEEYFIEKAKEENPFLLEVGYQIQLFNEKFLSITISRFDYFGGAYPNNYIYTLNFTFKPERFLNFYDLIDYSEYGNLQEFLSVKIDKHADSDSKDILHQYLKYVRDNDLDFTFDENTLTIYFMKYMPRVVMASSFLEIPIDDLIFKI